MKPDTSSFRVSSDGTAAIRSTEGPTSQPHANRNEQGPREDYNQLLQMLDRDPVLAAEKYELLRQRLIVFFDKRGWPEADILADETISRTARRPRADPIENLGAYTLEVARRLHLESIRNRDRNPVKSGDFEDVLRTSEAVASPPSAGQGDEKALSEIRMQCLDSCLNRLPNKDRSLLLDWYREEKRAKLDLRQQLVHANATTMAALKTRLCRLRKQLATCCSECIDRTIAKQRF